jgi:hypothetical protein
VAFDGHLRKVTRESPLSLLPSPLTRTLPSACVRLISRSSSASAKATDPGCRRQREQRDAPGSGGACGGRTP